MNIYYVVNYMNFFSLNLIQYSLDEAGSIIKPILQMEKGRLREVKLLAHSHMAANWARGLSVAFMSR